MVKNGVNLKKEAGLAKKAESEARKQSALDKQQEVETQQMWQHGANVRKAHRDEAAATKADDAMRKKQEKLALLASEEESLVNGSGGKNKSSSTVKKTNKKKSDLALLEDALISAADKNVKLKRQDLMSKQQQPHQQQQKQQQQNKNTKSQSEICSPSVDPLLANTESMMMDVMDTDLVGRQANRAKLSSTEQDAEGERNVINASGIDAALASLNVSTTQPKPKMMYNDFEARMLPIVKADTPGLRLSQYKEKVFQLWKKSPENPANQSIL